MVRQECEENVVGGVEGLLGCWRFISEVIFLHLVHLGIRTWEIFPEIWWHLVNLGDWTWELW